MENSNVAEFSHPKFLRKFVKIRSIQHVLHLLDLSTFLLTSG